MDQLEKSFVGNSTLTTTRLDPNKLKKSKIKIFNSCQYMHYVLQLYPQETYFVGGKI